MKLSDLKSYWPLLGVIPFTFGYLYYETNGEFGVTEIVVVSIVIILAFVILFWLNRHSSKSGNRE